MKNTNEMPLATEILHDMKVCACRWKIAFFAMLSVEAITLIVGYILTK